MFLAALMFFLLLLLLCKCMCVICDYTSQSVCQSAALWSSELYAEFPLLSKCCPFLPKTVNFFLSLAHSAHRMCYYRCDLHIQIDIAFVSSNLLATVLVGGHSHQSINQSSEHTCMPCVASESEAHNAQLILHSSVSQVLS